MILFSLLFLNY